MARVDNKHVYLSYGIPGEKVSFEQERRKQGFRSGYVVDIVDPSPHRVKPFCQHFFSCGGCTWQHIQYDHQLRLKHQILVKALEKYEIHTPEVPPVIASPCLTYYRHRVEYTFAASMPYGSGNTQNLPVPILGFHPPGDPLNIVDIRECFLQSAPSEAIRDFVKATALKLGISFYNHHHQSGTLRSLSIRDTGGGEFMVVLGFAEDKDEKTDKLLFALQRAFPCISSLSWMHHELPSQSQFQGKIIPHNNSKLHSEIHLPDHKFKVSAASFFQPNMAQAANIFRTLAEWADLHGNERVIDLYTGIGIIAIILAGRAAEVTGIENSEAAISDAKENAIKNQVANASFITGDILETFNARFLKNYGQPHLIVLDPPRSGTLIEIKKTIRASHASKVIYLSCNPVSLAFDLKQLTETYRVTRIQPYDMLPHTHHLETLVMLELK
jgi:23S rRNA (uracil1939-C5)-methyltransferase